MNTYRKEILYTKYVCEICGYMHDEVVEDASWTNLDSTWKCPLYTVPKECFKKIVSEKDASTISKSSDATSLTIQKNVKREDILETNMSLTHEMTIHNISRVEAMHTHKSVPGWDDILPLGGQLIHPSLADKTDVDTATIIGKNVHRPMVLNHAVYVPYMSFDALSREAKTTLAEGIAAVHTVQYSGEGGVLPDEIDRAYKYIFEYAPNKYSVTDENLKCSNAIEIKIGQGSRPGIGGHLPAEKVTEEVSAIRGRSLHQDIISPSKFGEIKTKDDSKQLVTSLGKRSDGRPISIKIAAGYIETDLEWIAYTQPDFITIDGRGGAIGTFPKYLKNNSTVPTVYALARARAYIDQHRMTQELIIIGGFRTSGKMTKVLAMGADAIAITSAAMIAISCQQYRICHNGKCPMGIATQDPELHRNFSVDKGTKRLGNYLHVLRGELKSFARINEYTCIHDFSREGLYITNSEMSNHTGIPYC